MREEISRQTEIGKKVQQVIAKGELVDDIIVDNIIKNKIKKNGQAAGFIFDGYPRTINQAKYLDTLLAAKALPLTLNLEVDENELVKRLKLRKKEAGRIDDDEKIIKNRLRIYVEQTQPLISFYADQGRLISVNGQGSIEEVFSLLREKIK